MKELLTEEEKELLLDLGKLNEKFNSIVRAIDPKLMNQYPGDMQEVVFHIHALQAIVMANAAVRAYPGEYRYFGSYLTGI